MSSVISLFCTRWKPADTDLQGVYFLDPALVNGVDFHMFDIAGSIGADVMIVDPTAPSYVGRDLDEARLFSECKDAKRKKHVLNGDTMIPLVLTIFDKLGVLLRASCRVLLMLPVLLVL